VHTRKPASKQYNSLMVHPSIPAELAACLRADIEKWRKVIQVAKIRNEQENMTWLFPD
jgi:hypothetical protein